MTLPRPDRVLGLFLIDTSRPLAGLAEAKEAMDEERERDCQVRTEVAVVQVEIIAVENQVRRIQLGRCAEGKNHHQTEPSSHSTMFARSTASWDWPLFRPLGAPY